MMCFIYGLHWLDVFIQGAQIILQRELFYSFLETSHVIYWWFQNCFLNQWGVCDEGVTYDCTDFLCWHAYSVPTYSTQIGKGLCEKTVRINRATCVYPLPPPTHPPLKFSLPLWSEHYFWWCFSVFSNWMDKLKLCLFATWPG